MELTLDDIYKVVVLLNAKLNGWTIMVNDYNTFYLLREKKHCKKKNSGIKEIIKICKKP